MQLIGYMDSPFVRRVAISLEFLGIGYDHRELSIFQDFEEIRSINPLVKVPTLVLDTGQVMADSTLIIDYLESHANDRSLMPAEPDDYARALQLIGTALVANEKIVQLIYEVRHRPEPLQHPPWIERLHTQLGGALELIESAMDEKRSNDTHWLFDDQPGQADITIAVMWRFSQHIDCAKVEAAKYPLLTAYSARAEALPQFLACPIN